jgi:DNA-binding MarR family transcriptional regulator
MESNSAGSGLTALFSELVRLETELWNAVESRVRAEHGLALGSYEVMTVVAQRPGCRVHDIAAALSITVGGVSKIVDRIEATGDCTRRANPGDRRSSIIELSPAGQRRLADVTGTVERELSRRLAPALQDRSPSEFTHQLTQLRAAVRASDPDQEAS